MVTEALLGRPALPAGRLRNPANISFAVRPQQENIASDKRDFSAAVRPRRTLKVTNGIASLHGLGCTHRELRIRPGGKLGQQLPQFAAAVKHSRLHRAHRATDTVGNLLARVALAIA
jgi:hypothetical protein